VKVFAKAAITKDWLVKPQRLLERHDGLPQFEWKWLHRADGLDEGVLEVPDFSATTDLYQVVANVYDMNTIPLDLKNLIPLIVATLLPFGPVVLMAVPPLDLILQNLAKFLL